jgi:hypothetical protein
VEFDASLRGQVDLARGWATVVDSAGSFERIDAPSARQFGGYTLVDVPLAFAAGGAIGEVVFDRAGKVAGLALEFPYPRPREPEQRRRQLEQGIRRGGFIVRNPEIQGLMRHSALAGHQGTAGRAPRGPSPGPARRATRDAGHRTTRGSSPRHAAISPTRCPLEPGDGSVRYSNSPSSEGTFHVNTPESTPIRPVDRG